MPAFLSSDWFDELEKLSADAPDAPDAIKDLVINMTVTGGPDGDVEARLAAGKFEKGHADGAPTKLTVPYDTAKAIFIEGNQQAGMQAFMSGQIKVEGDMSKMMAMQNAGAPSAEQEAFTQKIKDMTD